MEDPFTTPKHAREPALDLDAPPILARPSTSPAQLKRTLQAHLAETRKRLDGAGQLGKDLVKQEEEIEARLRELEESGGKIDPELKRKLAELEKEYNEVGRETSRALLTNKIMNTGGASPHSSNVATTLQSQGAASPTKQGVSSRRQRNQPSRQHDLEFAAELGQGLIAEVRKLQGLLSEREETLKVVQIEKSRLEQHVASIEARLKSLDDSEQRFKEENWNLELVIQDLHTQQTSQKENETRLQANLAHLEHEKNMVIKEVSEELETKCKHNETEIGSLRRALATNDTEKAALQSKVEELKTELEESHSISMRLRIQQERQEAEERRDPFALPPPDEDTPENSPPPSPTKHTPRHGQLEAETLKSSLHHAHRLIQNLRSNMHREKTEKNELKRLLQDTRDELETARNGFSSPSQKEKRRRPDGTFKKTSRPSVGLLGVARRSRDEVVLDTPIDDEWEEAQDDTDSHVRRTPGAYISSVPATDMEGDSAFETANERNTTDAFDTANENDATETEAYRTGAESPVNDNPTSADDLTETEEKSLRALRPKASALSSRSLRPLRLAKLRQQRSSIVSTASTEDDEDDQYNLYRYASGDLEDEVYTPDGEYDDEMLGAPAAVSNPRLKLRINRTRSKGSTRIASDSSIFNSGIFSGVDSSPASLNSPSSFNESPRAFRSVTAPDIRKSLFAELGSSPGMMSTDGEEVDTPSKRLSPSLMPREMVDCGVMTEVPYPDIPILLDDSRSETSERPSTAVTVVNDNGMLGIGSIFDRKPELEPTKAIPFMSDVGVQSLDEIKPTLSEIGVQSDEIPVPSTSEMGTQAEEVVLPVPTSEMGTQSDAIPSPPTSEMGTQSDEVLPPPTSETGTQFDPELEMPEEEPAVMVIPVGPTVRLVKDMSDTGTQFDPDLEKDDEGIVVVEEEKEEVAPPTFMIVRGEALETAPVEEPEPEPIVVSVLPVEKEVAPTFVLVKGSTLETAPVEEPAPKTPTKEPIFLDFSTIVAESTAPISPPTPPAFISSPPVFVTATTEAAEVSDEDTPKKVSETTEEIPVRSPTPTPSIERRGFFSSLFGSRKQASPERPSVSNKKSFSSLSSKKSFSLSSKKSFSLSSKKSFSLESEDEENEDTIRKKDTPRSRPALPVPVSMADQSIQTDLSSEYIDKIVKDAQAPKKTILFGGLPEPSSVRDRPLTPSTQSQTSTDSIGRGRGRMGTEGVRIVSNTSSILRPGSSSSLREQRMQHPPLPPNHHEQIAAAQQKIGGLANAPEQNSMGPPPIPTHRSNVSFRPRTPGQHNDQSRRPETPASHAGSTPKPPKFSATRSEISSPGSRRSSLSSFATELDDRFNMHNDGYPARGGAEGVQSTDPRVIQAITQTMIGEYLWKYTRNTGRGSISHSRHKRFFWIHPYTRTLYWSDRDPQSAGRAELRAKSVAIEAVRVVTDDNVMPPGLHRKSLVIITPGRTLKFTAPTSQRHETWFNALSYLLLRDAQEGALDEPESPNEDDLRDYNPAGGYSAENSLRPIIRGASSLSSFRSRTTRDSSPTRNTSSLSNRRPGERERLQGSLSRLSNIFRPSSGFGTYSSRNDNSVYGISEGSNSADDLQRQIERQEMEIDRMENVRACCDGKHDVGTLSRKGGKQTFRTRGGMNHGHSHSHG
ncbi:hypothetical protein K440DRAFT_650023 [Wilcoxina mikolae CBS 423.85]|nr:hypothetical protein K440DRAFT_650023 [Wilcoxina mikolae CBS 423.85]